MNWEAIAAGGELLAALAVLVSILYLARQIRQSAAAAVVAVNQGTAVSFQGINVLLASSPDLADIIMRGAETRSVLTPAEVLRYDCFMLNFFNVVENVRLQETTLGVFSREREELLVSVLRKRLVFPGVLEWWLENSDDFVTEFVGWVESIRASSPQVSEPTAG
jgi:hypothetical protein